MTHAMPATLPITTYYHYAAVHTCMPPGNQLGRLAKWNLPQLDGVAFGFLSWTSLLRAHLEWLCEESKREVVLVQGVNRLLYKHVQISNCILNELKYIISLKKMVYMYKINVTSESLVSCVSCAGHASHSCFWWHILAGSSPTRITTQNQTKPSRQVIHDGQNNDRGPCSP